MGNISNLQQPKGFYMIFFLELWERFGFYGLQAVLAAFFVNQFHMGDAESFAVFGAFSAMVYGFVSIGGYIGDKVLGTQRTIILGAVTLACGYIMMALAGTDKDLVYLSLGCVAVGNGLFKANPSNLLSRLYSKDDSRLDSAFTLYYMAVNLGSFVSMLLVPIVSVKYGISYGFWICAIGMVMALGNFICLRHWAKGVDSEAGLAPLKPAPLLAVIAGTVATVFLAAYLLTNLTAAHYLLAFVGAVVVIGLLKITFAATGIARKRMIAAIILMVEAILFFVLYQQMPTSLNFFAIKNVEPELLGITIANAESFQTLNPFWIIVGSPVLAYLYSRFGSQGRDLSMPGKFAVGMFLCSFAFLVLPLSAQFASEAGLVSAWWLVASYGFQSIGELLISGLGLSMVAKLVPENAKGFIMGAWFMTTAVSAVLGGIVAGFTEAPQGVTEPTQTLLIYSDVFLKIGIAAFVIAIVMLLAVPMLNRLINEDKCV